MSWRTLLVAVVVAASVAVLFGLRARAADSEPSVYVSITPCRLLDTRPGPDSQVGPFNTPVGANQTITVDAHGNSGECSIPDTATGVAMNTTALHATEATHVTVWPDGEPKPKASSLNLVPGMVLPNAVTTALSDDGRFNIANYGGEVNVIVDVVGYYLPDTSGGGGVNQDEFAALAATVENLQVENEQLKELLAGVSRDGDELTFTGMNINIVNGEGETQSTNGVGNLVLGYNESNEDERTGSHTLVIGEYHTYTSYAGIVAGSDNATTGGYATVTGGRQNTASGHISSVSGGWKNTASGGSSSITGGANNTASGGASSVTGGASNTAAKDNTTVTGGENNLAYGNQSVVVGGENNIAGNALLEDPFDGAHSVVVGGSSNATLSDHATMLGGDTRACEIAADDAQACGEGILFPGD